VETSRHTTYIISAFSSTVHSVPFEHISEPVETGVPLTGWSLPTLTPQQHRG